MRKDIFPSRRKKKETMKKRMINLKKEMKKQMKSESDEKRMKE